MGDPNVAIGESELNLIGEYVQNHLPGWMEQLGVRAQPDPVTNTQLLERVIRVEEELKAQREVMITKFEASDARIGDLIQTMNDRFGTVDERFSAQTTTMNKHFSEQAATMNERFTAQTTTMNERFAEQAATMNERFAEQAATMNERFTDIRQGLGTVKWFIVTSFVVIGAVISLISLLL